MPYFLVLVSHVGTSQAYACGYACAYRTSGNQALQVITGHQSEASIQSYCDTPTFEQFRTMSNKPGEFFDPAGNENNAVAVTKTAVVPPPAPSSQLPSAIPSISGAGD